MSRRQIDFDRSYTLEQEVLPRQWAYGLERINPVNPPDAFSAQRQHPAKSNQPA
jgi:hypothetical protein